MNQESHSVEETLALGRTFAATLEPGDIVCMHGDLGAGKTHFIKGIASFFGIDEKKVSSPTFTLINEYHGSLSLFHFDFYRINKEEEALEIGVEEYLFGDGISLIEWPERIAGLLPEDAKHIELTHLSEKSRKIRILTAYKT